MKKAVVFIFSVCVGLSYGDWEEYTWEEYPLSISNEVRNMQFINAQYGWISTTRSELYHSSDSGKTWNNLRSSEDGLHSSIRGLYFWDKNNGWVSGLRTFNIGVPDTIGFVFKTTDGGKNWILAYSDSSWYVSNVSEFVSSKIFFPTPQTGYFVANAYGSDNRRNSVRIGKTTDGGINWTTKNIEDFTFSDAGFVNADTGWISGRSSTALGFFRTVDGGSTWEFKEFKLFLPTSIHNFNVFVLDGKKAWANGRVSLSQSRTPYFLAVTNDFGDSWDTLWTRNELSDIVSVFGNKTYFLNDTVGFAFGGRVRFSGMAGPNGHLIYTLDGGQTWDFYKDPDYAIYIDDIFVGTMMCFIDSRHGWIINDNFNLRTFSIYRTTNAGGLLEHVSVKSTSPKKQNAVSSFAMKQSSSKKGISNINYTLSTESSLSLSVYNLKGTRIAFAPERTKAAGAHSFSFKAPKGFYIVEARVKNKSGQGEAKFTERIFVR